VEAAPLPVADLEGDLLNLDWALVADDFDRQALPTVDARRPAETWPIAP
jgi:hypothetical protein